MANAAVKKFAEMVERAERFPPGFPIKPDGRVDDADKLAADYLTDDRMVEFAYRLRESVQINAGFVADDVAAALRRVRNGDYGVKNAVEAMVRLQADSGVLFQGREGTPPVLDQTLLALSHNEQGAVLLLIALHCWLKNPVLEQAPLGVTNAGALLNRAAQLINLPPSALITGDGGFCPELVPLAPPQLVVAHLWRKLADTLDESTGPHGFADAQDLHDVLCDLEKRTMLKALHFSITNSGPSLRDELYYSIALAKDEPLLFIHRNDDESSVLHKRRADLSRIDAALSEWESIIDRQDFERWLEGELKAGRPREPLGAKICRENAESWDVRNNRNHLVNAGRPVELAGEMDLPKPDDRK
jgi:hypothetical protein